MPQGLPKQRFRDPDALEIPSTLRHARHERFEQLAVFLEVLLGDPLPRCGCLTAVAAGEELLAQCFILEHIEDTKGGRDWLCLQLGFQERWPQP